MRTGPRDRHREDDATEKPGLKGWYLMTRVIKAATGRVGHKLPYPTAAVGPKYHGEALVSNPKLGHVVWQNGRRCTPVVKTSGIKSASTGLKPHVTFTGSVPPDILPSFHLSLKPQNEVGNTNLGVLSWALKQVMLEWYPQAPTIRRRSGDTPFVSYYDTQRAIWTKSHFKLSLNNLRGMPTIAKCSPGPQKIPDDLYKKSCDSRRLQCQGMEFGPWGLN